MSNRVGDVGEAGELGSLFCFVFPEVRHLFQYYCRQIYPASQHLTFKAGLIMRAKELGDVWM